MINITNSNVKTVRYTGKTSARGISDTDLQISFDNKVIGTDTRQIQTGDIVLVASRQSDKSESIKAFACRVGSRIEETVRDWKDHGGLIWENNFSIEPLSTIQSFSPRRISTLLGGKGTHWNYNIVNPRMGSGGANATTIGANRAKLVEHLINNHPI